MNYSDDEIVSKALEITAAQLRRPGVAMSSPEVVKNFLTLRLAKSEREVFGVLWLNIAHSVIAIEDMFFGTLDKASVYPREVIKAALSHNAAALICYHCHPSGRALPSEADKRLTEFLSEALAIIDVRLLDHIIVAGVTTYSFAENSLI